MEWRPAGWSVCLHLLIFPCTIKSRSSPLAPAHPGGPRKRAVKRLRWWLGSVLGVPFSTMTLMAGWQEEHLVHKNLIQRGSLLEQVEKEDLRKSWLTQVHLEKWPLNARSSNINSSSSKTYFCFEMTTFPTSSPGLAFFQH